MTTLAMIDMDGVVSDFDKHIFASYGKTMQMMSPSQKDNFWNTDCVSMRFFANSPAIQEGIDMVKAIQSRGIDVAFLTSTGGGLQHIDIAKQKLDFLQRHGMGYLPVSFATGTKSKALFARPGIVLIDDRKKVVDAFRSSGGVAYLFSRSNWKSIASQISEGN